MLVLFETAAGYALFKLLDEDKLKQVENLYHEFETPQSAHKILKLKHFKKFKDTTEALAATTAAVEGKLCKSLKKMLKSHVDKDLQDKLLVADAKLGSAIKDELQLQCLANNSVQELMRCIRSQLDSLVGDFAKKEMTAMALGLAHSLSRYKLKFSPDKVDTMIVQAVSLLDDLDKELNNYVMRCREWYGWHFPELGKMISDNLVFVKAVKLMGTRENAVTTDFSDTLPEHLEERIKEAAEISMGTEISDDDIINILQLCDQFIELSTYRTSLYEYLQKRMMAMAPNLTILVGDLVGARLISHAGSLINLAKHPASTVQILGAEKALFRALKSRRDTPKYGLIYHAQLMGQASAKNKGKMARMLAAKASLAVRVDALSEDSVYELGVEHKVKLESRLRFLEEGNIRRISGTERVKVKFEKYQSKGAAGEIRQYAPAMDSTLPSTSGKRKRQDSDVVSSQKEEKSPKIQQTQPSEGNDSSVKKKKKKLKTEAVKGDATVPLITKSEQDGLETSVAEGKKKKKKRLSEATGEIVQTQLDNSQVQVVSEKKKKET